MPKFNHSSAFVAITSKWFNDQKTSDLQVRLKDDRVLHCHRLLLSSWSETWAKALEDDQKASSIDLISHDPAIVEKCLQYCYTSEIDFVDDDLTKVHLFVHQYNIKALETACEQAIVQSINQDLSASNCMVLYCYLLGHKISTLPDAVQSLKAFVCNEFATASKSSGFLRVPVDVLCQLLKEDLIATEDDVLDACCRWLDANPNGNDPQIKEKVLQLVRFPMLSAAKLLKFNSHPLMSQCDSLKSRHHFALQWFAIQHIPSSEQEPLRIKLMEENKSEILTPRMYAEVSQAAESPLATPNASEAEPETKNEAEASSESAVSVEAEVQEHGDASVVANTAANGEEAAQSGESQGAEEPSLTIHAAPAQSSGGLDLNGLTLKSADPPTSGGLDFGGLTIKSPAAATSPAEVSSEAPALDFGGLNVRSSAPPLDFGGLTVKPQTETLDFGGLTIKSPNGAPSS